MPADDKPTCANELERQRALDDALKSHLAELPDNHPKGILGERGVDIRKEERFEPDLNAGISQENDVPVIWLAVILGFFVGFLPGLAILWISKRFTTRQKVVVSLVAAVLWIAALIALALRR